GIRGVASEELDAEGGARRAVKRAGDRGAGATNNVGQHWVVLQVVSPSIGVTCVVLRRPTVTPVQRDPEPAVGRDRVAQDGPAGEVDDVEDGHAGGAVKGDRVAVAGIGSADQRASRSVDLDAVA